MNCSNLEEFSSEPESQPRDHIAEAVSVLARSHVHPHGHGHGIHVNTESHVNVTCTERKELYQKLGEFSIVQSERELYVYHETYTEWITRGSV